MAKQANKSQKSFFAEIEEQIMEVWQKESTFEESVKFREGQKHFEFYDGPPFANNLPHYGHVASSIVKDAVARYKTMRGYHVPRRFGWDCHGLPAEMKAEQDLDLGSKAGIEQYGVDKFINYCSSSVTQFTKEWEHYIHRIGRWVDFDDNYYTMDQDYMESVIWAFKQLYEKGLVGEGYKVMPYCHVCETSLSHFETRQDDAYRDRDDPAVTVRFILESGETLLAWTTTPWTLPANLAVAVNKNLDYAVLEGNGERLVLTENALERYQKELKEYKKIGSKKGREFIGLSYEPLFDYFKGHKNAHRVLHADFVTDEDGTGIAHEAPGFGEEDQILCEAEGIEIVAPVDKQGNYTSEIKDFVGLNVFEANSYVIDHLKNQGTLFKQEIYTHSYPHCWRTDNPLIYRAVSGWTIDVPKIKDQLLKANESINWIPENVKEGAFGKWLEGVRPWNVSRDRFWGAPIPVWKTDDGEILVMGSLEEIKELAVEPEKVTDLHKPAIDNVVLKTQDGKLAHRVSDVFDCWFESGAMPFAQHHYPFEDNKELSLPSDFIVEYIGQTRGWFYTLHVLAVALFDSHAFSNVIAHGVINGNDGRKMSKRLGNYPDLQHTFDAYGADSLRLYLFGSPVMLAETIAIDEKAMLETQRGVMMTLWNSYSFFETYAKVDGWQAPKQLTVPESSNILDKWILARLAKTTAEITKYADEYNLPRAVRPLRELIDDLSNWYIRRSRRRFWKSDSDEDKDNAYHTLYYVLIRTSQLLAPWSPFLSEHLYRQLSESSDLPTSIHLTDWPQDKVADKNVLEDMSAIREIITEGLSKRAEAGIKLRQPLSAATLTLPKQPVQELLEITKEELNVKEIKFASGDSVSVEIDTHLSEELKLEGIARDIVRQVQNARKKATLDVDNRIKLSLGSKDTEITKSIEQFGDYISKETLANSLNEAGDYQYKSLAKINSVELEISLEKDT